MSCTVEGSVHDPDLGRTSILHPVDPPPGVYDLLAVGRDLGVRDALQVPEHLQVEMALLGLDGKRRSQCDREDEADQERQE